MSHSRAQTSGATVDNQGRLQHILLEGFGRGDLSLIDQLVAPRVVEHQDGHPHDRDGLRAVITGLRTAFPNLSYTSLATAADGEKAWAHARYAAQISARSKASLKPDARSTSTSST